jgi:hypothetical protein
MTNSNGEIPSAEVLSAWEVRHDTEHDHPYYYNATTGESRWTPPDPLTEARGRVEREQTFLADIKSGLSLNQFAIDDLVCSYSGNVNQPETKFNPPLYTAVLRGWRFAVEWLLSQGADPNARNDTGYPILQVAGDHPNCCEIAALLLSAGARLEDRDFRSVTVLKAVVVDKDDTVHNYRLLKFLLKHGASFDPLDTYFFDSITEFQIYRPRAAALLAGVHAAGGWQPYVDAPRKELLEFRQALPSLRRGPSSSVPAHLERLFCDKKVPEDVFKHVLAFWRSARDY